MPDEITASFDTLMQQAPATAAEYMAVAIREIDRQFGEGQARAHPDLVASFMRIAAMDFEASILAQQIRAGLTSIAAAIESRGA